MEKVYSENEIDIINPKIEMDYSIRSSFEDVTFPQEHDFYEITLILSGLQEFKINGRCFLLSSPSIILIRPHDVHTRKYIISGRHINIAFLNKIAVEMFHYLGDGFPYCDLLRTKDVPYLTLEHSDLLYIMSRIDEISIINPTNYNQIKTSLRILIIDLFTKYFINFKRSHDSSSAWFSDLLKSMEKKENFSEGLNALLRVSNKSHEYLCRVFKSTLNCTPTEYINDLRLKYAANLLIHTDLPIIEISLDVGFNSVSHFNHLFVKKYQLSPYKYRKQNNYASLMQAQIKSP